MPRQDIKQGIAELSANLSLIDLDLGCHQLENTEIMAIAEALRANTTLRLIDLSGNKIRYTGALLLAEALKVNHGLQSLNLSYNQIGPIGASLIAETLTVNYTLQYLNIEGNHVGNEGAITIADALKANHTLISINLKNNQIGNEGAFTIADALRNNTHLRYLELGYNWINCQGGQAIAEALKENRGLEHIDLRVAATNGFYEVINAVVLGNPYITRVTTLSGHLEICREREYYINYLTATVIKGKKSFRQLASTLDKYYLVIGLQEKLPNERAAGAQSRYLERILQEAKLEYLKWCLEAMAQEALLGLPYFHLADYLSLEDVRRFYIEKNESIRRSKRTKYNLNVLNSHNLEILEEIASCPDFAQMSAVARTHFSHSMATNRDSWGMSILQKAVINSKLALLEKVLEMISPEDLASNQQNGSLLHLALQSRQVDSFWVLLESGEIDLTTQDQRGNRVAEILANFLQQDPRRADFAAMQVLLEQQQQMVSTQAEGRNNQHRMPLTYLTNPRVSRSISEISFFEALA